MSLSLPAPPIERIVQCVADEGIGKGVAHGVHCRAARQHQRLDIHRIGQPKTHRGCDKVIALPGALDD